MYLDTNRNFGINIVVRDVLQRGATVDSRTELLLHEIRKSPRSDQIAVIRRLIDDVEAIAPEPVQTRNAEVELPPEELKELRRRIERMDESYDADELMRAVTREVRFRTEGP